MVEIVFGCVFNQINCFPQTSQAPWSRGRSVFPPCRCLRIMCSPLELCSSLVTINPHCPALSTGFMYNSGLHYRQLRSDQEYEVLVDGEVHPKMKAPTTPLLVHRHIWSFTAKRCCSILLSIQAQNFNIYNINEVIIQTRFLLVNKQAVLIFES